MTAHHATADVSTPGHTVTARRCPLRGNWRAPLENSSGIGVGMVERDTKRDAIAAAKELAAALGVEVSS
jgi:hypothetical protein